MFSEFKSAVHSITAAATAAAKSLQSCPTLCDPYTASHQAPPFLGFSRQEHRSGLPFPSPMHESESEVAQSCPTLRTAAYEAPPSMAFSRQECWSGVPLPSLTVLLEVVKHRVLNLFIHRYI